MARINPATFAPFASGPHSKDKETVVERILLMAGHIRVPIKVKVVLDGVVYIAVEEVKYAKNERSRSRVIKRGAVLMANRWLGGDEPLFAVYNNGVFDALRALGEHIPDTETREIKKLAVSSGNLEMVLAMTWVVRKSSPREEQEDVRYRLQSFVERWCLWQNELKCESLDFTRRAAECTGTIPFPALSPMIGAAERRISLRRAEVRQIVGKVGKRHAALLLVFDQAWRFRGLIERELNNAVATFEHQGRFNKKGLPARLERIAAACENVSLAPFGRRTFNHLAREVRYAAQLIEHDEFELAQKTFDRSLRSLFLLTMKREINEIMVVILAMKRLGLPNSEAAIQGLVFGIEAVEAFMSPKLDYDFVLPITDRCAAALGKAIAALRSDDFKRLDTAYKFLRKAQEPI